MALLPRVGRVATLCLLLAALLVPQAAAAANGSCSAPPAWFSGVPDVPTMTPASPCQFQQWAWQAFLALLTTSAAQPVPRYLTWDFPKPDINALFCESACQGTPKPAFNLCGGPPTQEVVNATTQPGFTPRDASGNALSGEVIDQAGNPVYFTAHVSPDWVGFVTSHRLSDPVMLSGADAGLAFPAGSFEIKTSWRLAEGMSTAEKAQYFITHACVLPEAKDCCLVATRPCPSEQKIPCAFQADLALLGFHVTGGANHHPELVWATFEHQFTAPDCAETPQPGPWALYDGTAECSFQPSRCNQPNAAATPAKPINVCRKYPHGGAGPDTARQIDQLNRDVQTHLPRRSPLRFYELVGTLWGTNPAPPLPSPSGTVPTPTLNLTDLAGSPLLSNTSLETFKQDVSCFGCHNSQFPGEFAGFVVNPQAAALAPPVTLVDKTLYVSHVVLFPYFFTAAANCSCPAAGAKPSGGWQ